MLHAPNVDPQRAAAVHSMIQLRAVVAAVESVRAQDEAYSRRKRKERRSARRALADRQEALLANRLRNLEQQRDTLEVLLHQIDARAKIAAETAALTADRSAPTSQNINEEGDHLQAEKRKADDTDLGKSEDVNKRAKN